MDCVIVDCVRECAEGQDFCEKHQLAADNIEETYSSWQAAYGEEYTRNEYLERLANDYEIGSGDMVIEVAEYLLNQE